MRGINWYQSGPRLSTQAVCHIFHEQLQVPSGKFKGQNFAKYLMAKITQLNSRGDEAEYVRLRTLLDSMPFDIEKGENIRDFLHAL